MKNSWIKRIWVLLSVLLLTVFSLTGCDELANEILQEAVNAVMEEAYSEDDSYNATSQREEKESVDAEKQQSESQQQTEDNEQLTESEQATEDKQVTQSEQAVESEPRTDVEKSTGEELLAEEGQYTSKEDVAAYLNQYGHLPSNFITKKEAKKLGWVKEEGNLGEVAPGKSIGGDYFGNYEETLPDKKGREYHECDIDFDGKHRGAKRIVFSNDGLIYYTEDHYGTFELLYGEE